MRTLAFHTTKSILIECGASRRLASHVRSMGCQSVLVVTDPGVLAAGLLSPVLTELERDGLRMTLFAEVQADPPESVILAAVDAAKTCAADCVVGFGGGSSLDADLTIGLPVAVTAATGIDAMVHAIESYTSKHLKNPISDCLAREALRLLSANLHRACRNGADLEARENMLLGACLAGMAFANAPVAAVHALAYPLGARFHIPHGLSNSLVLEPVMRFNLETVAPLYAELAAIVLPGLTGDAQAKANALADYLGGLAGELQLPTRLRELGIGQADVEDLAVDAARQTRLLGNNPRELGIDDIRAIYEKVL